MKKLWLILPLLLIVAGVVLWPRLKRSSRMVELLRSVGIRRAFAYPGPETYAGWKKFDQSPVLGGGDQGVVFDISVIEEGDSLAMYTSWRTKRSIARATSTDGLKWTEQSIVLANGLPETWEETVNRPSVLKKDGRYFMWYTGQQDSKARSCIGVASSSDGIKWTRLSATPILAPEAPWEKTNVMCPHVIYDEAAKLFKMWYSAGDYYEPDAIGYATSPDGIRWTKHPNNPVFKPDHRIPWESHRTTACCVLPYNGEYVMFYIGFRDIDNASMGVARSKDGISNWERHPENPIIVHGRDQHSWDADAVYKPWAVRFKGKWLLYYNGRRETIERIGVAIKESEDLWK